MYHARMSDEVDRVTISAPTINSRYYISQHNKWQGYLQPEAFPITINLCFQNTEQKLIFCSYLNWESNPGSHEVSPKTRLIDHRGDWKIAFVKILTLKYF